MGSPKSARIIPFGDLMAPWAPQKARASYLLGTLWRHGLPKKRAHHTFWGPYGAMGSPKSPRIIPFGDLMAPWASQKARASYLLGTLWRHGLPKKPAHHTFWGPYGAMGFPKSPRIIPFGDLMA